MTSVKRYPGGDVAVVAAIPARAISTTTAASDRVRMGDFHAYQAIYAVGTNGAAITCRVMQHDAATGGTSKVLPGATTTINDDDNWVRVIEFDGFEFDIDNGFDWVSIEMQTTSATFAGAVLLGVYPRYGTAIDEQSDIVEERIVI